MDFPLDPEIIASEIGIPLDRWPGNCHAIATKIAETFPVQGMRVVRGHYVGFISGNSVYSEKSGTGIQQHSWLEAADGRIVDPTRWAIVSPSEHPFIYIGVNDCYDEAGLNLYSGLYTIMAPDAANQMLLLLAKRTPYQLTAIAHALGMPTIDRADSSDPNFARLANSLYPLIHTPHYRHRDARSFYLALEKAGLKALVKIDLWNAVFSQVDETRNIAYYLPALEPMSYGQLIFQLADRFVKIEEYDGDLGEALDDFGMSVQGFYHEIERIKSYMSTYNETPHPKNDIEMLPKKYIETCLLSLDAITSQSKDMRNKIERYARSCGYSENDLDELFSIAGQRVGYGCSWL